MDLVYICSPLRGNIELNQKKAISYCEYAANHGVIPLAPHTIFTQYLDDSIPQQRERGLAMGIELLKRCDQIWVCGDTISLGMQNEITYAKEHDITAKYITENEIIFDSALRASPMFFLGESKNNKECCQALENSHPTLLSLHAEHSDNLGERITSALIQTHNKSIKNQRSNQIEI